MKSSNDNIYWVKRNKRGENKMKAETLERVHTHTHTYSLVNKKINIKKIAIKPINI